MAGPAEAAAAGEPPLLAARDSRTGAAAASSWRRAAQAATISAVIQVRAATASASQPERDAVGHERRRIGQHEQVGQRAVWIAPELVSRLTTASVDRHWGVNTYQASSECRCERPALRDHRRHRPALSPASLPDSAHTVPSARPRPCAASPGPARSRLPVEADRREHHAARAACHAGWKLYSIAGPVQARRRRRDTDRNHSSTIIAKMMPPTRPGRLNANQPQRPNARLRRLASGSPAAPASAVDGRAS